MRTIFVLSTISVVSFGAAALGQGPDPLEQVRRGVGDTSIFAPLALSPAPNVYRTAGGAPGAGYWQNRADYDLHATLDTGSRSVRGAMTLRYTNHSPDTLTFLWVQTEQNAFRPRSLNALVFPEGSPMSAKRDPTPGFVGGDVIDRFAQLVDGKTVLLTLRDNETLTKVALAHPLVPGESATFAVAWHFMVPTDGDGRMGHDGALYEIAQWYPRVCVYDDVRGWNIDPYVGQGEFYLEYGDYTMSVTVPAGYIVAATGTLDNPHEVLTATEIARLTRARISGTPVAIVTANELRRGTARPTRAGVLTWKFSARNVRDAVWAAAPNYQWDATSWHGILAQSYYRPSAAPVWGRGEAADQARTSIQEYSERWSPYPYPQISVVEGPAAGMEYPMLAMESRNEDRSELYGVLTHEVGHNWFPMIVGSNERLHYWQDEGLNTFINTFSEARRYPKKGDLLRRADALRAEIEQSQVENDDIPIELPTDRTTSQQQALTEYDKTAVGLQLLREEILGPEAFDDAFRTYITRWAYKHPTPADFYRTMESVAGRRLDWFWREWFYENPHFDQAIDSVLTRRVGDTLRVGVVYGNHARGVLPILVRFTFTDGTTQDSVYPAEVWGENSRYYVRSYRFVRKHLARIDLDPQHRLVDVDRSNNRWVAR